MEFFTNYAVLNLSVTCLGSATTITVTNASVLPTGPGTWRLLVDSEIMVGTSRSGSVVNVLRGQEGTTITSHAIGAQVIPVLTAGALAQLKADALAQVTITNVHVDFSMSPYKVLGGQVLDVDTIGGVVVIDTSLLTAGQSFQVNDRSRNFGVNKCTVLAPPSGTIQIPGALDTVSTTSADITLTGGSESFGLDSDGSGYLQCGQPLSTATVFVVPPATTGNIVSGTPYNVNTTDTLVTVQLSGGNCVANMPGSTANPGTPKIGVVCAFVNAGTDDNDHTLTINAGPLTISSVTNPGTTGGSTTFTMAAGSTVEVSWNGSNFYVVGS